ncbi:MAG: hypothetical protein Q9202_003269 [Teloschistes flavicans]
MEASSPFNSQVYKILVGPTAKPFYVHADILSKSEMLRREISGQWKESEEKQITWSHWNAGTVAKFIEWLYTDDYKCPYPIKAEPQESSSPQNHDGPEPLGNVESNPFPEHHDNGKKENPTTETSTSAQPLPTIDALDWAGCRKLGKLTQAEEYDTWTGHQLWRPEELDYHEVFMTHAELYVMACTYMVDDLKNMAWQRLRSVLRTTGVPVPGSALIENLASLTHYTFNQTGNRSGEEDPLRMLVTTFAALHFTAIKGPEIDELIMSPSSSDKEFFVALTSRITQQMKYLEAKATNHEAKATKRECSHESYSGVYQNFSGTYRPIVVGAEGKIFYAHASLLSKSEVLRKEVEGSWREKSEKKIVWPHWSVSAVARVLEWLYTGDYENIYPEGVSNTQSCAKEIGVPVLRGVKRLAEEPPVGSPSETVNGGAFNAAGQRSKSQFEGSVLVSLSSEEANPNAIALFLQASDKLPSLHQLEGPAPRIAGRKFQEWECAWWCSNKHLNLWDFKAPFMINAEIYVMACHYLLDELKSMAWQRLRLIMMTVQEPTPGSHVVGNVMELIEYVYRETAGSRSNKDEPLRKLVSTFTALHFPKLKGPELTQLIESQTLSSVEFLVDLADKLAKQMNTLEDRAMTAERREAARERSDGSSATPSGGGVNTKWKW